MASKILTNFLIGTLLVICCLVQVSTLSNSFKDDENYPTSFVSDGVDNMQVSGFNILADHPYDDDDDDDDFSFDTLTRKNNHSFEAIYQFGDSLSDTGNYKCENPYSSFAQPPYGKTFFHQPTGRCSDGPLIVDYFAEFFKLPFLEPYLNKNGNFKHGVNFAVTGAAALDTSTLIAKHHITPTVTNNSLSVQLGWFKSHLHTLCSNPTECKEKLSKALFMMGEIGGNDYNFAIFGGMPMPDVYKFVPEVVQFIKGAVEELIHLGATHIAVPGNFPVGCMSVYLATYKTNDSTMYDELKCLKYLNKFAKFHNGQLQKELAKLRKDHPGVAIYYLNYYAALREVIRRAASLGFNENEVHKTCCGKGNNEYNFDFGNSCGVKGVPCCENPEKRVNWDGYHLTGHAYQEMAKRLIRHIFHGTSTC